MRERIEKERQKSGPMRKYLVKIKAHNNALNRKVEELKRKMQAESARRSHLKSQFVKNAAIVQKINMVGSKHILDHNS